MRKIFGSFNPSRPREGRESPAAAVNVRSTANADKCCGQGSAQERRVDYEVYATAASLMIMAVLEVAAVFAEWAIAVACAFFAVAWVVKELLMGVCKIERRLDGKVVIITGEQ